MLAAILIIHIQLQAQGDTRAEFQSEYRGVFSVEKCESEGDRLLETMKDQVTYNGLPVKSRWFECTRAAKAAIQADLDVLP